MNNLSSRDSMKIEVLVEPNRVINFEKANLLFIQRSEVSDKLYAVKKAKYLGKGVWRIEDKIEVNKKQKEEQKK